MKNDMKLIMESWKSFGIISESFVSKLKKKDLDEKTIEKFDNSLSNNEGYALAKEFFDSLEATQNEESNLDESIANWFSNIHDQASKKSLSLQTAAVTHPKFKSILKIGAPALALAFLAVKAKNHDLQGQDFGTALELMLKGGDMEIADIITGFMMEERP